MSRRWYSVAAALLLWLTPAIIGFLRWSDDFSLRPHWPVVGALFADELILLASSSALLILLGWLRRKKELKFAQLVFGAVGFWSLVVTLNPFLNPEAGLNEIPGRLRSLAYVQTALIVPGLIWIGHSIRDELPAYISAIVLPLTALTLFSPLPLGLRPEYLRNRGDLIEGLKRHKSELEIMPIIIASHGEEFVVTAVTGIPSQQRMNSKEGATYWLLHDVSRRTSIPGSIILVQQKYSVTFLVEHDALKVQLQRMDPLERRLLFINNPNLNQAFHSEELYTYPHDSHDH